VTFNAPAQTTVQPRIHTETWDQLGRRLTRHTRRADKNGEGWSPAIYRHDDKGRPLTRGNGSVEHLSCAVADVDHVELEDLKSLTDHVKGLGLAGVIYSTFSHTVTSPRVRLVIPFSEPVTAELWPRLWPTLNETIFLHLADRAASDASRMYFAPATPGDETTIAERWDGAALDWRALPLADPETVASSTPVATEGMGPAETVAPEDMPILERLFSGRRGEQRMRAWTGDYTDFGGNASSADQSIANGLVTYCRGDVKRAERVMRAGAWRSKWDERRGSTTWLGYTLGKALAAYRTWAGSQDEPETAEERVPADETLELKIARLERELRQERTAHATTRGVVAVQMTNLRTRTAERDDCRTRALETARVLRNPALKPPEKLVAIALAWRVESAASRGQEEVRAFYPEIAEAVGMSEDTVGKYIGTLSDREDAPLVKDTRTEWRKIPHPQTGELVDRPTSATYIRARGEGSILSAVAAYRPEDRPKHGGKRLPLCPEHPTADLVIRSTTHCGDCDRQLGPPRESLRPQVAGVGDSRPPTVDVVTNEPLLAVVGGDTTADDERAAKIVAINVGAARLQPQDAPVGPRIRFSRDREQAPRCIRPGCPEPCGPGDKLLCVGHRAEATVPAVAGASE
jgi:hypothetical protein